MNQSTPKIILQEREKFMKKQDALPKKEYEFSFTYKTEKSRDNALRKFLKSFPKKDITSLHKSSHKSWYNGKFHPTVFYEIEMALHVRNTSRVTKLCVGNGFVMGHSEPRKTFPMPSKKEIDANIARFNKRENIIRKELSKLSKKERQGLEKNAILGDELIRKLKPLVKENPSNIWHDLCELSKEKY